MTDSMYEDDEKLRSILDVLKASELFGEVISIKPILTDEEVDTKDEDWVDVQAKYGHDTTDYVFGDRSESRAGTISTEVEPVSGHDWVSPVTSTGKKIYVISGVRALCGLKEADCFDPTCRHVPVLEEQDEERYEFKQDWNSMADRPTENFFMGLPGLRYIESDQQYFTRLNTVCRECNLYTPSRLETCQNCDRVLVSK
jgi:hypothetical protein